MIKLEQTKTYGWKEAMRGMRNPKNSWALGDTMIDYDEQPHLGPNDWKLAHTLANAGSDHGKFLRMIVVFVDITAPLYWWKEFDTYKVGTVANSCSTMHKLDSRDLVPDDFSCEDIGISGLMILDDIISYLNNQRKHFKETGDKKYWRQMIQMLPSSYNQKRTVMMNYAVLKNMYHARKAHKLTEWHEFCDWIEELPYAQELIISNGN